MTRMVCLFCGVFALASVGLAQTTPGSAQQGSPDKISRASDMQQMTQPADLSALIARNGGSLMRASVSARQADNDQSPLMGISLTAVPAPKPHTLVKHDVITVVVNQESQTQSNGNTDLQRSQDLDAKLTNFIQLNPSAAAIKAFAPTVPPELTFNSAREQKGVAAVERDDSFTTRIAAEVVDVKPNDTLVLQARESIKVDDDEQTVILTGICRVQDVDPTNSVLSTSLYDLNLKKITKGKVHDTTKRNLISKILDFLNPF